MESLKQSVSTVGLIVGKSTFTTRCLKFTMWAFTCAKGITRCFMREKLYPGETKETMEANRQKIQLIVKRRVARAINLLVYYLAKEKFKG